MDEDHDEYLAEGKKSKSKGKGKARQLDKDMDIDEAPAQPLALMEVDSASTLPPHHQAAEMICIKPLSTTVSTTPTPGPSDHTTISAILCKRCVYHKSAYMFREGAFACVDCQ